MLRLASYDIVFQEIPGEVTLALNISGCPNRCPGCHSPHLWENIGEALDETMIQYLLDTYGNAVTCVCVMGGDADPQEVGRLAGYIKSISSGSLRTGWYSGKAALPAGYSVENFDYIKLGPYIERLGGLDSPGTNQRLYKVNQRDMVNITLSFGRIGKSGSELS